MSNHIFIFMQWLRQDLSGRYRGSLLGPLWPVLQPIAQVAVFTLIFHGFMQVKWPAIHLAFDSTTTDASASLIYAIHVLAGLSVFNFFSEVLGRAPGAILAQANLITKVRFPLEILPAVVVSSAMVHLAVGSIILILSSFYLGVQSVQVLLLPLWIVPLVFYALALSLTLSGLGVYIRDISQVIPSFTALLMFLTPIFYPLSSVPESIRPYFGINPLTWAAESLRDILLGGGPFGWADWGFHLLLSMVLTGLAFQLFLKIKAGFSDVV